MRQVVPPATDSSLDAGDELPGWNFIAKLRQEELWQLIPHFLLKKGLRLFASGRYDSFDAIPTDGKGIEVSLGFVDGASAFFTEKRKGGHIRSTCTCATASRGELCVHQVCLLIVLWHVLVFSADKNEGQVTAALKKRIREWETIFSSAKNGNRSIMGADLEAIILSFPEVKTLRGEIKAFPIVEIAKQFHFELKTLPDPVDSRKLRFHQQPTPISVADAYSWETYPYLLRTQPGWSDRARTYYSSYSRLEDNLRQSLRYRFADGVELTAQELLFHNYGKTISAELLPRTDSITNAKNSARLPRLVGGAQGQSFNDTNQVLAQVALAASSNGIPIYVTDSFARSSRQAILLSGVESEPTGKFVCSVDLSTNPISLACRWQQPTSDEHVGPNQPIAEPFVFANFAILPTGVLFFHQWDHSFECFVFNLGTSIQSRYAPLAASPFALGCAFQCGEVHSLSASLASIRESFDLHGGARLEVLPASVTIKAECVMPRIDIKRDGTFSSELSVHAESGDMIGSIELAGLYPFVGALFQDGIGGIAWEDNTRIATQRKGTRRARDLKILRHQGLAHAIFQEVARGLLNGDHQKKVLASIEEKTGLLVKKIEGNSLAGDVSESQPPRLSKYCSGGVWELVRGFVSECYSLFEDDRLPTFSPRGEEILVGTFRRSIQLMLAQSEQLAEDGNGEVFLKSKVSLRSADDPTANKSFLVRAFLPLCEKGFAITMEGSPIEMLNPTDFRPEFKLADISQTENDGRIDWFELCPRFFFKGIEITPEQAQRITIDGIIAFEGKLYLLRNRNLPSFKRLQSFWERIQSTAANARDQSRGMSARVYHLPKNQTLEMLALRASGVEIIGGPRWNEICGFYDQLSEAREDVVISSTVHVALMPFQIRGVRWLLDLYTLGLGGILADEMGLGKTLQTLAFLEMLRCKNEMGRVLIVVPTSLTFNWASEAARFTPNLPVMLFQPRDKEEITRTMDKESQAVVICTYGLLAEHQEYFAGIPWNIHVFDEAQNLKNITAKRTTASRAVSARFKFCLTGTPLENHLGEFYSLMDLVVPGSLGDLDEFRKKFVLRERLDREDIQALRLTVKPLILRRTKTEILTQLPPKSESVVKLLFEDKQKRIYRDVAVAWNERVQEMIRENGEARSQLQMLTALLRLRQICSDPAAVPNVKYVGEPPKLSALIGSLLEITESGDSALVFTQFLHTFERVRKALADANIPHFMIHGGHSRREREESLRGFHEAQSGSVMLMTLKTGGVGLNLTKASYVFHLEPWWNPAVENQATDRAHRMGQEKPVQVFRYLIRDSVEEKIEILKQRKSSRFNAMFASEEDVTTIDTAGARLSKQDFDFLVSQRLND